MNQSHRSVNNPNIRKLATLVLEDINKLNTDATREVYTDMIKGFKSFKQAKNQMVKDFLNPIRDQNSSLRGKDCVLLIESSFFKEEYLEGLHINDCEKITENNVMDTSNILRFISPIKFKGLEKNNVALIVKKPTSFNQYEIYLGITRAKNNLKIYIVYE